MKSKNLSLLFLSTVFILTTAIISQAQDVIVEPGEIDFGYVGIGSSGWPDGNQALTVSNQSDYGLVLRVSWEVEDERGGFELLTLEAAEARLAIRMICDAAWCYRHVHLEDPSDIEEIIEGGYWLPDSGLLEQWNFDFIGSNPITQVQAVSTEQMPDGPDRLVLFDMEYLRFANGQYTYGSVGEFVLLSRESREFIAAYTPYEEGEVHGTMILSWYGDNSMRCNLSADGYMPQFLALSTQDINFGYVPLDGHSRRMIDIWNISGIFLRADFEFSDPERFAINNHYIEDVQNTLLDIAAAVEQFREDHGEYPSSVGRLLELNYLNISEHLLDRWSFTLIGRNPVRCVEAVSTAEYEGGAGHVVLYYLQTKRFSGFGDREYTFLGNNCENTYYITFHPQSEGRFEEELRIIARHSDDRIIPSQEFTVRLTGEAVLSTPLIPHPSSFILLSAYPNPFNNQTTVTFTLPHPGPVSLSVFDPQGRRVTDMTTPTILPTGANRLTLEAGGLPSGSYLLRLEFGSQVQTRSSALKLMLVK